MYWMGIDGGGTSLRVVIVDDELVERASVTADAANPNAIGREQAAARIREAVKRALHNAGLNSVAGVGIGIAGAAASHSAGWLLEVLEPVLPDTKISPSSDVEIALVGGRGQRTGIVLLAGTGSIAYGVNAAGEQYRAGGWGYLLGDEGSGYWIGQQALRLITLRADGRLTEASDLPERLMEKIGIAEPSGLIDWLYKQAAPADVAGLAPLVLSLAASGDAAAQHIIHTAADYLSGMARHVQHELNLPVEALVYAGHLLTTDNLLSQSVTENLGLPHASLPRFSAVVGAALLAKLALEEAGKL